MEQRKIDRINFLARKSKSEALSASELSEQKALRAEYIASYRKSLRAQLNNVILVDEAGNKRPLKPKTPSEK